MSVAPKIVNGDISFNQRTKKVEVVADEEKAFQLSLHTVTFDERPDGKGAGLTRLVGIARNFLFLQSLIEENIELAFNNVIADQFRTPAVDKTLRELISEVRDISIEKSEDDPRNYDLSFTVVLLDGQTFVINGVLS